MLVKFLILISASFALSCSNKNNDKNKDQASSSAPTETQPTATPTSTPYPKAQGKWTEARTFIERTQTDPITCPDTGFSVQAESGTYRVSHCESTKTGQLTPDEFRKVDSYATQAYSQTTALICPQIFKLDQFYGFIDSSNPDLARHFDPDSSCYDGNETAVSNLKLYLQQLLTKYE